MFRRSPNNPIILPGLYPCLGAWQPPSTRVFYTKTAGSSFMNETQAVSNCSILYYGVCDTAIALATARLDEVVARVMGK